MAFDSLLSEEILFDASTAMEATQTQPESRESKLQLASGHENAHEYEDRVVKEHEGEDVENFLPEDSPLRSKNGELKAPVNVHFKDYETFVKAMSFEHWKRHFERSTNDKVLGEIARAIVSKICTDQSRKLLRSHNGCVPFRKAREHITPLGLMLHEFKLWSVNVLRTLDPFDEESFSELKRRALYADELRHKEVWGRSVSKYAMGLRKPAHNKLFRFFTSTREEIIRAEQYCFRQYSSRSSREKLRKVSSYLKQLICDESRVLSGMFDIDHKLRDPKAYLLQPLSLLNEAESLSHIDFKNFVNVLLYRLFQNKFAKACLLADFETLEDAEIEANIANWAEANLFCHKGEHEPILLLETQKGARVMPREYGPAAHDLRVLLRKIDSNTPTPDPPRRIVKRLKATIRDDLAIKSILELVMKFLAALQNLFPALFALHKLYTLAGEGGDYTIYDSMKQHVIRIMEDCLKRIHTLKNASTTLRKLMLKLCAEKEEEIKAANMRKQTMIATPIWVANQRYVATEFTKISNRSYKKSRKKLLEIAQDADEYSLTATLLSDRVNNAKRIFDLITGPAEERSEDEVESLEDPLLVRQPKPKKRNTNIVIKKDKIPTTSQLAAMTNAGKGKGRETFVLSMYSDDESDF